MNSDRKNLTTRLLQKLTEINYITSILIDLKIRKFKHIGKPNVYMYSLYLTFQGETEGDGQTKRMYICHTIEDQMDQWNPLIITSRKVFERPDLQILKLKTLENIKRYDLILDRDFEDRLDKDIRFEYFDIDEKLYKSYISEIESLISEITL